MLDNDGFDLVCVTETWLRKDIVDSVITNNRVYSVFRKDRFSIGGGVYILLDNTKVKAVPVRVPDSFDDLDVLCVDIISVSQPIRLIACYRPPSSDTDIAAVNSMKHFIGCVEYLCDVDKSVILLGDFNLPNVDWSNPTFCSDQDRCSTLFVSFTKAFALQQHVYEPTRYNFSSNFASVLDLVFL